jgi:hypothetical protein
LVNLDFTWYNRITNNKLTNLTLPGSTGLGSILSNNGTLRNRGVELELNLHLLRNTKDWKWDVGASVSHNKNHILELPNNGLENNRQDAIQVYDPNTGQLIWVGGRQEGHLSGGELYAFVAQGVFKDEEEVMKYAANRIDRTTSGNNGNNRILYGPAVWATLTDAEKAMGYPIQPGDVNWKDINGDGVIDNYDKELVGYNFPKIFGGLTSTLSWKDLSLFVRMDYTYGNYQLDNITRWMMGYMQGDFNTLEYTKDTWTPENPNAKYPKYYWADQLAKRNYDRPSTMFLYDASYLCIRNVSLSYSLPRQWVRKAGMENLSLSVTGQNLGYLTKSKMYSPESNSGTGGYALPRTVILGVSLTF